MTGELCDCYETKREGVHAILDAVAGVSRGRRVRVWGTDGVFVTVDEARRDYLKVAAANWHALATFAGQYVPEGPAVLIDVGSTTSDVIPLLDGTPISKGKTDTDRLDNRELVYTGVRRTPLAALVEDRFATELFATTLDVYLHLGLIPEDPADTDTADGRPATKSWAFDRLCRMFCGDRDTVPPLHVDRLAEAVMTRQIRLISRAFDFAWYTLNERLTADYRSSAKKKLGIVTGGSGEFLAARVDGDYSGEREFLSLTDRLGPEVSGAAPAYAVAVLATEAVQPLGERITRGLWPWSGS
jgi:probable H4MPT-linked C1 transfer pathway protein